MSNSVSKKMNVFARKQEHIQNALESKMAQDIFTRPENALICVDKETTVPLSLAENSPLPKMIVFSRVLILFSELPVKIETIKAWKDWVLSNKISEYRMDFLRIGEFSTSYIEGRILRHCRNWDKKRPEYEGDPDERWTSIGQLLDLSEDKNETDSSTYAKNPLAKDSPELLTSSFGTMGEVMLNVYNVFKRFETAINSVSFTDKETGKKIEFPERVKKIAGYLRSPDSKPEESVKNEWQVSFPKILLYGETGVGKTLVSRYLHSLLSKNNVGRPLRISIPEFVGKEEDFEYALFGYAKGAYTGGLENGSPGLLIENMGKVVFLDEIEEANNTIQAKLLAFMDDYRVRPRGWLYDAFYCPVLIVAATNCSVAELQKMHFRKDLLARFTDIETIPPLRDRKESMDFIIDCLLQQDSINHERKISRIGKYALAKLKGYSYEKGNFRELEDVLRNACVAARKDGRDYLCECDIMFD